MTTFWTVLILTYTVPGYGDFESRILFPSMRACGDAMLEIYAPMERLYGDSGAKCEESDILSGTMRPIPRPEGLGK